MRTRQVTKNLNFIELVPPRAAAAVLRAALRRLRPAAAPRVVHRAAHLRQDCDQRAAGSSRCRCARDADARRDKRVDAGGGDGHRGAADAAVIHMHGARGARVCRRACARARGRRSSVAPLGRPREPGPEGDEGEEQEHRQGESSRPPITSPAPRPSAGRAARARRLAASRGPSGRSIGRVGLQYPSILAAGLCGGGLLGGALI